MAVLAYEKLREEEEDRRELWPELSARMIASYLGAKFPEEI